MEKFFPGRNKNYFLKIKSYILESHYRCYGGIFIMSIWHENLLIKKNVVMYVQCHMELIHPEHVIKLIFLCIS